MCIEDRIGDLMKREQALPIATDIWKRMSAECVKCVIAGELRRGRENINRIEIVCLPIFDRDLFDSALPTYSRLEALLHRLRDDRLLEWAPDNPRSEENDRHFVLPSLGNLPLTLTLANETNWGLQLALHTGNDAFCRALVTPVRYRGLLPNDLKAEAGCLQRVKTRFPKLTWELLACPTEGEFFRTILRLPVLPPHERNERGITRLRRIAQQGGIQSAA